jgi:N-acetylneuraminic acid mutarotase
MKHFTSVLLLTFCSFFVFGFCLLFLFSSLMIGCSSPTVTAVLGNWSKTTPFKGRPRSGAMEFTIGSKAYAGLGYDGDQYVTDFYQFDIASGYWETKKSFPGTPRERAVSFTINGKGYVGLGYNRGLNKVELGDFWEYDPDTDQWTQIADFGGTARYNAIGFGIGSFGYVGTGYDGNNYNSDFWQYNSTTNSWTEIVSYPGEKIEGGLAFVINGKAYVCTGRNNGSFTLNFYKFDPEGISWTKLTPASSATDYATFKLAVYRYDAMVLTVGDYAYIVGGVSSTGATDNSVYEFDSNALLWSARTSFEGSARSLGIAYVLEDRAFVGTGQNGSSHYDDIWEFKPAQAYDVDN